MQLLVSPRSLEEALECLKGGADIIDVKNPEEGSLGANFPWVIKEIRQSIPKNIPLSATIGDVPFKPGTIALAALGAALAGADYVKVGLFGTKTIHEAISVMKAVTVGIKEFNLPTKVVAAGYAEGANINSINPLDIPLIAHESFCNVAMIDTFFKNEDKSIFDVLSLTELDYFLKEAKRLKLLTALGGSIQIKHIPQIKKLNPDIIGIRGAVCAGGDRISGSIKASLIRKFKKSLISD